MFNFVRISQSINQSSLSNPIQFLNPDSPPPTTYPKRKEKKKLTTSQPKPLNPVTFFHNPTLTSSKHVLTVLKQAATIASETATEDQASDYTNHAKNQRSEFELEVSETAPTTDQLRSILDYASPGAQGKKGIERKTYVPGEIVKGARDAEDALKRFKEDQGRFVRPIVCSFSLYLSFF